MQNYVTNNLYHSRCGMKLFHIMAIDINTQVSSCNYYFLFLY